MMAVNCIWMWQGMNSCLIFACLTHCNQNWSSTNPKGPMLHLSLSPCTGSRLQLTSSSRHWSLHEGSAPSYHRYTVRRCLISDCFYGLLYVSHPPYCCGELDAIHHSNHWIFERCHNHAQNGSTALCEPTVWWMTSKIPFQDGDRIYVPGVDE